MIMMIIKKVMIIKKLKFNMPDMLKVETKTKPLIKI